MPPEPQAQDPNATSKPVPTPVPAPAPAPAAKSASQVDIDRILLPQKEVRKVESERRVSAGVLLDQEQKAGTEGLPKPEAAPKAAPQAPAQPKEVSEVQPLETYQADIEKVMRGGNASVVSIAAAEAQRRAHMGAAQAPEPVAAPLQERVVAFFKKFSMVLAGVALLVVAAAALGYVFLRPTTVPVATPPVAPFISVDDTQLVSVTAAEPARDLINKLTAAKKQVALSLGLIARLIPSVSSTTPSGEVVTSMSAQTFMAATAPNIPADLLRTLKPDYLLGVHVYDANQPFLILNVDSYEQAYSGMLAWEGDIHNDLAPLFTFVPMPRINSTVIMPVTTTTQATSTASTSEPVIPPPPVQPKFIDKIVENHDARVLQNDSGDIYFLWTFLDRNTLVITTNAATLREIISRFKQAPVTALPQ